MKAEFLRNQLLNLYTHLRFLSIPKVLETIYSIQDRSISSAEKRKEIRKLLDDLKEKMASFNTDSVSFSYKFRENGKIARYLTINLYTVCENAFRDFDVGHAFFSSIDGLKENYESTLKSVLDAYLALSEFDVENLSKEIYTNAYIEIRFPEHISHADAEALGKEISDQARILKILSDSFGQSRSDFDVFSVSTSKLSLIVKTNYRYATHFSAIVYFVLGTANSYLDMRIKLSELNEVLGKTNPAEVVSDSIATEVSKKCAQKIADEFFSNAAAATYDSEKCAAGVKKLFESVERGFRYDLHVPEENVQSVGGESDNGLDGERKAHLRSVSKEISIKFDSLPKMQSPKQITSEAGH